MAGPGVLRHVGERLAQRGDGVCHGRVVETGIERPVDQHAGLEPEGLDGLVPDGGASGYVLKQARGNGLLDAVRRVAQGESLLHPAVTARVLDRLRRRIEDDELAGLTDQETRLLDLIAQGLTNHQIGEQMFLAEKTIKNYVSNLLPSSACNRRDRD